MSNHLDLPPMEPVVTIIDDDDAVRRSLVDLFQSVEIAAKAYGDPIDYLANQHDLNAGCILLDLQMPTMNGLEFQAELARRGSTLPIIFMTGQLNVVTSVKAMKAGAHDFLLKPFGNEIVLGAAKAAMERDLLLYEQRRLTAKALGSFDLLTRRERQVLKHVTDGLLNKQIAHQMRISEIMVKLHRGRMMKKMECRNIAELVRRYDLIKAMEIVHSIH